MSASICATNADIGAMVDEGNFRRDLLYRINTIEIHIPPLRERGNDVILLAEFFLERYARKYKKEMHGLTREAKNKLLKYNWPGNVRELQHTIERAVILGDGSLLKPRELSFPLFCPAKERGRGTQSGIAGTASGRESHAAERGEHHPGSRVSWYHPFRSLSQT